MRSNCFMKVLRGSLVETTYDQISRHGSKPAVREGTARSLPAGADAYINDDFGVHKVGGD